MFEQEKFALLDLVAYIEDAELRTKLEEAITSTVDSLERARQHKAIETEKDAQGLCTFNEAWVGRCGRKAWAGATVQMCKPHTEQKCRRCGEQATRTCPETFAFVCGEALCDKHSCTLKRH